MTKDKQKRMEAVRAFQDMFVRAGQAGFRCLVREHRRDDSWSKLMKSDMMLTIRRNGPGVFLGVYWSRRRTAPGETEPIGREIRVINHTPPATQIAPTTGASSILSTPSKNDIYLADALPVIDALAEPDQVTCLCGIPFLEEYVDFRLLRKGKT